MTRIATATTATLSLFLTAGVALAHVTLETREARAGAGYKAVLKVPHGCDGAATTQLRVQVPDGLIAAKPMPKPGWTVATVKGNYGRSYSFLHGEKMNAGVKEIVWSGGRLADDNYDEFVFAAFVAGEVPAGRVYMPVTQHCETGEASWSDIPAPGQDAHALKTPAPALVILAQHSAASAPASGVFRKGPIAIDNPWARATPGGAKVAGGYMKITNAGPEADRLVGGSVPFAGRFEVHEMATQGGVMTMRPLTRGLEIKPGATVELKPGGYHVMFMDLKGGLKEGETVKGTLTFEKAGAVEVEFKVGPIGGAASGGHSSH